jgi:hypothetical protein
LPDGTVFVASGSLNGLNQHVKANNNPTYEVLDAHGITSGVNVPMDIMVRNQPVFMYPFVHLLKDGNLFFFVAKSSEIFNVALNQVVKKLPDLSGLYRTYPNTGGSVMLPLRAGNQWEPEIMICGGGAYQDLDSDCDATCGRIQPMKDGLWSMTSMPQPRGMVEGINLLDGKILWLNGVQVGAQGFGIADNPALDLLIYDPESNAWSTTATSTIPRLYHSVALMLADGKILIAGSNPNEMPVWPEETIPGDIIHKYPTELRVEIYTPTYLQGDNAKQRPQGVKVSKTSLKPGDDLGLEFTQVSKTKKVEVILYTGGFVTHSVHMGQQMYYLESTWSFDEDDGNKIKIKTKIPSIKIAPGPWWVYVMADGVPSIGQVVMLQKN